MGKRHVSTTGQHGGEKSPPSPPVLFPHSSNKEVKNSPEKYGMLPSCMHSCRPCWLESSFILFLTVQVDTKTGNPPPYM